MATISNITVCPGGNHAHFTITTARGSRQMGVDLAEVRQAVADSNLYDFILAQVASVIRNNPNDTPVQRRNRLQATTFME